MSSRERFEAWWGGAPTHIDPVNAIAWQAWQAARAEALEEAALWHEDEARRISGEIAASLQIMRENASAFVGLNTSMDHEYAQAETHREAADIIRALKDKEPA